MLQQANQIFQYNGSTITFQKGDSVMVNATQMAKPFGKEPKFWLSNQSTKDYITELSKVRFLTLADLVIAKYQRLPICIRLIQVLRGEYHLLNSASGSRFFVA